MFLTTVKISCNSSKTLKHRLQNKGDWKGLSFALIISSELAITIQDNVRALDNDLNCPMVCANVAGGPQARVAVFAKDTRDSSDH